MTALNKQALREAAEKATPGRWEYYPGNTSIEYNVDSMVEDQGSIVYVDSGDFTQDQTARNGEFIAAANPATVLTLLDELEAAKQDAAKWFKAFEKAVSVGARYEERIAELEARTVKLPEPISVLHRRDFNDAHRAIYAYPEAEVNAALAAAGIGVKGE